MRATKSITVARPRNVVYAFWRDFENLPRFMRHLESVSKIDEKQSHWKAKAPLGQTVEWDAEITSDIENHRIGWKSLEGATIPNSGVIEFRPTIDRGTEMIVTMTYEAPGGKLGEWIAWALGEEPSIQIAHSGPRPMGGRSALGWEATAADGSRQSRFESGRTESRRRSANSPALMRFPIRRGDICSPAGTASTTCRSRK